MSPVSGQRATLDELLARLTAVCGKCGLTLTKNQGIALLLLLAMSDRIGIVSPTPAPAATLIRNIAAAMGWERSFAHQISAEQRPMVALRPVDATPVLLLTSLPSPRRRTRKSPPCSPRFLRWYRRFRGLRGRKCTASSALPPP